MERKTTDNRRLVIRISPKTLSFSTRGETGLVEYVPYDMNNGISLAANMREALQTEAICEGQYGRVMVMVSTPVLMMPVDLFEEATKDELYRYTFTCQEGIVVMHSVLPDLNSVAVFCVSKDLRTVLSDRFKTGEYMPVTAPVWRHLHQRSFTGPRNKLYAYFHDGQMDVMNYQQNRFKFCNSFAVNHPNDALYYMLNVWKQLSMQPEHDEMYMVGDAPFMDELNEKAQDFVKRVFLINPSGEFNRAPVAQLKGMPYDLMVLYIKGR